MTPTLNYAVIGTGATELHVGDKYLVTGPTTGALYGTIEEMHDDSNAPVTVALQGSNVSFRVDAKIRPSDKLFRIESTLPPPSVHP